jgi:hypothetical protein
VTRLPGATAIVGGGSATGQVAYMMGLRGRSNGMRNGFDPLTGARPLATGGALSLEELQAAPQMRMPPFQPTPLEQEAAAADLLRSQGVVLAPLGLVGERF